MSGYGTFLPFVALQHHGNYLGYRRHVADGAGRPSLTPSGRAANCSLDHLVGAAEQVQRERNTERLGGLEVDDQFDLRGLLDRQVGGLLAIENPAV